MGWNSCVLSNQELKTYQCIDLEAIYMFSFILIFLKMQFGNWPIRWHHLPSSAISRCADFSDHHTNPHYPSTDVTGFKNRRECVPQGHTEHIQVFLRGTLTVLNPVFGFWNLKSAERVCKGQWGHKLSVECNMENVTCYVTHDIKVNTLVSSKWT